MAKRISVINFKGGVGKTTLTFNLAAGLARYHEARVLLMDMDHQSSLSIVCLTGAGWVSAIKANHNVNQMFRPFIEQSIPFPKADIIEKRAIRQLPTSNHYQKLDIVPASLELDDVEIDLTASHQGNAIHSEWNKRTLVCRWLDETGVDAEYDYIIFDCPPATKIVSQNAIAASHGYIIPVIPEAVMERGAPHLAAMIRTGIDDRLKALAAASPNQPRPMHVADTKLAGVVITRIRTHGAAHSGYINDHTQHLASLQSTWQHQLLKPYIEEGTGVSQALGSGLPVYDQSLTQNVGARGLHTMFRNLTAALKARIDAL